MPRLAEKRARAVTQTDPAPTTSATILTAADMDRWAVVIHNAHATETMYVGPTSGVTTTSGHPVVAGATFIDDRSSSAWYGIMGTGTGDARISVFA